MLGGGIAGLSFALKVSKIGRVAVLCKRECDESNTHYAQGGIASVISKEDSFDLHVADTLTAGAGLCHEDVVRHVVSQGPARIRELIKLGVKFTARKGKGPGSYDLGQEGGHSQRRILHAGDMTGRELQEVLLARVMDDPKIDVLEYHLAVDLITLSKLHKAAQGKDDRCLGAYVLNVKTGEIRAFQAGTVLLATGGAGKVYLYTSNPDVATGDGIAMAYRAGARIANMEFIQFHPTCLYHPKAKSFLISEAVRGEGAVLLNARGVRFMEKVHPRKDLAPRDIVARAIDHEMKATGAECVFLDISHKPAPEIIRRFPNIYAQCLEFGFDMTKQPLPVVPAAHYLCGGVMTSLRGETTLPGLYASGEVAFTGLHGANRLASNSLLEALVFSHDAALSAARRAGDSGSAVRVPAWDAGGAVDSDENIVVSHNWEEIRRCMSNYVGIVRSDKRLARARHRIRILQEEIAE